MLNRYAAVVWFGAFCVLSAFIGGMLKGAVTQQEITVTHCEKLGQFYVGDKVFTCAAKERN